MRYDADSVVTYLDKLPPDRREVIEHLRSVILDNLPSGFEETVTYGMIGYVVPKSLYPAGYKPTPDQALPFLGLASQKNHIAVYHMGIFMSPDLLTWFKEEYHKRVPTKLDMGKSCIRFRNAKNIPFDLIGELCRKMTVDDYIRLYKAATTVRT